VTCHNGKTAIGINHNPDTFDKSNNDCVFCHTTTTFKGAFPNHNVILADVTAGTDRNCHSIKQFSLGGVYNHRVDAADLRCDSCHTDDNSINAIGKAAAPKLHVVTAEDCGVCHGVAGGSFINAKIDHSLDSVVSERCDSCHGSTALGKSANHIQTQTTPTIVDCNACHSPGNFATGTFDHLSANTGTLVCSDCHNNTNSVGKITNHIPTALECDSCHTADTPTTPGTFKNTLFHYNLISENFPSTGCNSCHDGVITKGKDIKHLSTVRDCSNCHIISNAVALTFTGAIYDHGDPGISNNCASCHDGVTAIDKTNNGTKTNHIPAKKECSECHSNTTVPGGFATNKFLADVHPNNLNGCAGCHAAKYLSAQPTLLKSGSVNHVPTSQDCHSCHSNTNFADKTQFTHDGITGNCSSCHDGSYYASAGAKGKDTPTPAKTHPVTTTDCGSCHGVGNGFTDGGFDHSGTIDNCSSCHGDKKVELPKPCCNHTRL